MKQDLPDKWELCALLVRTNPLTDEPGNASLENAVAEIS